MSEMKHDNARDPIQIERMKDLRARGLCFFCDKNYLAVGATPLLHESQWWYVKKNDFPYAGTNEHLLIVSKAHVTILTGLSQAAWVDLQVMLRWVESSYKLPGFGLFVRQGNLHYTGGTIDHLHIHVISGGPKPPDATLEDNILVTLGHKAK